MRGWMDKSIARHNSRSPVINKDDELRDEREEPKCIVRGHRRSQCNRLVRQQSECQLGDWFCNDNATVCSYLAATWGILHRRPRFHYELRHGDDWRTRRAGAEILVIIAVGHGVRPPAHVVVVLLTLNDAVRVEMVP